MKKVILTSLGVVALTLMSFTGNDNEKIIEVTGNRISIKNTDKISETDLKVLSELIGGWTYCERYSHKNSCETRAATFPNATLERQTVQKIIDKYNQ